ncbi:phosphotransferase family protein [Streptomyces albidoflavus]|uniref:phosphotransferase family protein n=1 Tax=Streptomyces albidoflavus TaxID=1886 RepID=UPI00386AE05A
MPIRLELPRFDPFGKQELRIDRALIPEDDRTLLRKRWRELQDRYAGLRFDTHKGPVHGDAHVQNLMVDDRGQVMLIDFEAFCYDHPEWDLMVTAVEHHSLGWQSNEQYAVAANPGPRTWSPCRLPASAHGTSCRRGR